MKPYVRTFHRIAHYIFAGAVAAALLTTAPGFAQQAWRPDRNVELIVGSTPGSGQDKTARVIQRIWKDARLVETTSAVVNKVGGGGVIADTYVAQRAGDAHTLMTASPTLLTNHISGRSKLNHTDFTPVALLFDEYIAFVVRPESRFKTGNELIAALKKNPASENQRGQHELPICYGERSANCLRRLDQPNIQFSPDSLGVTTQRCE